MNIFWNDKPISMISLLSQSIFQTWVPFLYLYIVGGVVFFSGLYLTIKSGSLNRTKKHHRLWLKILIGGYLFFMSLHAFLIISALYF